MFDQDRSAEGGKAGAKNRAITVNSTSVGTSAVNRNRSPSRMNSFTGSAVGLGRTVSTPQIADSPRFGGSFSGAWTGMSPHGWQAKRRASTLMLNNRTQFKNSSNQSGCGRVSTQILTDARSPGLVSRLVRYNEAGQSQSMNRSQSLSSVYRKPGQFPLVHLRKQEPRYAGGSMGRRSGSFNMTRIAPPEKSLFQQATRAGLLRTGSLQLANDSLSESLLAGRVTAVRNGGGGDDATDAENRVITPCAELEATPTRSVLDALKEISRKRINSEELDADRIKKQCQELSELDSAGSGPPSSTAAVATGTQGLATKRNREQLLDGSPSSPSETSRMSTSGQEYQMQKKRFCVKNNDILSSLSSSTPMQTTPKRIMAPRVERRFNVNQSPTMTMSGSLMNSGPVSSSTLVAPATPDKFSSMASSSSPTSETSAPSKEPSTTASTSVSSTNVDRWSQPSCTVRQPPEQPHRAQPKITLFNRPYNATALAGPSKTVTSHVHRAVSSDGEDADHGEGSGKVQFVKPKEKSPNEALLPGSGAAAFSSSGDPLKKPAPSKLTVMLKCLSGDLNDYEEEDPDPEAAKRPPPVVPSRSGFTFGATVADTVDAPAKELLPKLPTASAPEVVPTSTSIPPAAANKGLSALINNPIKDAGLDKVSTPDSSPSTQVTKEKDGVTPSLKTPESNADPKLTAKATPAEASKSLTFNFGVPAPSAPSGTATANATSPKPITTTAAPFTFGTPVQKPAQIPSSTPATTANASSLISFSPAVTFGTNASKQSSPVVQFGSPTTAATTAASKPTETAPATSSTVATSPPTFSFKGATSPSTNVATTTATTSISAPTFGTGSTFGTFKLPTATQANVSSGSAATTATGMFANSATNTTTSTATTPATAAFTFGSGSGGKSAPTPAASIPVFGSGSGFQAASVANSTTPAPTSAGFTFGSAISASTPKNVLPSGSPFTFGAAVSSSTASSTAQPASAAATTTTTVATTTAVSTFPTFSALAGASGGLTVPNSATSTSATAAPSQTFVFGELKPTAGSAIPASSGNLFAAAAATNSSVSNPGTTNLFGAVAPFGQSPQGVGKTPAATGATAGITPFGGAQSSGPATASSPFTFGAAKASPSNGVLGSNGSIAPGSIFGSVAANSAPAPAAAPTSGLFTFGSTQSPAGTGAQSSNVAATPAATPSIQFNAPKAGAPGNAAVGTAPPNATPFTFNAMGSKPADGSVPGAGSIFGSVQPNNSTGSAPPNATVPTFGAVMNGTAPVPAFGNASIFGSPATAGSGVTGSGNVNPAAGNSQPGGSVFGAQTNGPQNATNTAAAAPSPGGMFTFGASSATNKPGTTFGGSTFGGFNSPAGGAGGLTNGIGTGNGGSKPFTFGAASPAPTPQSNVSSPAAPAAGGFNFNVGSNAAKPFTFTGGLGANANAPVASPPMFGAGTGPSATPVMSNPAPNASPFTFGAMAGGPAGNGNVASPQAPFTFGAAPGQQGAGSAPSAGMSSPFNFSAGNVAAVAPQPQQQQPGATFNFSAGNQQPFGAVGSGTPGFGAAPAFGAPAGAVPGGIMPTFSIGTNSTPNGPTAGQRRMKVATRRVK